MTPLERISQRVNQYGDVNDPTTIRPLLTLREFFEGNEAAGSIGCNLVPMPLPSEFHDVLRKINAREDVGGVYVQISEWEPDEWPFSDVVWVVTSGSEADVVEWFPERLRPDECVADWPTSYRVESREVPKGMRPIACWWD